MDLPRKYREAIHLYYYEELSVKEIAAILKKAEATVKTNLHRGRELLKRKLEEAGYERS
jgi:RNA polymerase sigma-70 factor (ECF subfamily)